jgi:hypothetical protein
MWLVSRRLAVRLGSEMSARELANELRERYPGIGRKADYENSRAAAIKLFCLQCMGGSRQAVAGCEAYSCPLFTFRSYGDPERPARAVPSLEWYEGQVSEEQREKGLRLARGTDEEGPT